MNTYCPWPSFDTAAARRFFRCAARICRVVAPSPGSSPCIW